MKYYYEIICVKQHYPIKVNSQQNLPLEAYMFHKISVCLIRNIFITFKLQNLAVSFFNTKH